MSWFLLLLAGLLEIVWAVTLKGAEGFTRFWPSVLTITFMLASFVLLGIAMRSLPASTAYAVWVGVGAVGTAVVGIVLLGRAGQPGPRRQPAADRHRPDRPQAGHPVVLTGKAAVTRMNMRPAERGSRQEGRDSRMPMLCPSPRPAAYDDVHEVAEAMRQRRPRTPIRPHSVRRRNTAPDFFWAKCFSGAGPGAGAPPSQNASMSPTLAKLPTGFW